jgi:hypothetical protein
MQELIVLGLTLALAWFILRVGKRNKKKPFSRTLHKQSDTHRLKKLFFSMPLSNNQQLNSKSVGRYLGYRKGRVAGGLVLEPGLKISDRQTWRVKRVGGL